MQSKYFILALIGLFGFGSLNLSLAQKKDSKKEVKTVSGKAGLVRKLAQQGDEAVHEIVLQYEGKVTDNFSQIKLYFSPSSSHMTYQSFGNEEYNLDCPGPHPNAREWTCFSPCEGGSIKISFSKDTGFKDIQILPFKFRPRHCDGSESDDDPYLTSRKTLHFKLGSIYPAQN